MNTVELAVGAATDVGTVRECNEDSHGFVRAGFGDVLVVCDGMGGHAAGDVASQIARDMVVHKLVHAGPQADIAGALVEAMEAAHDTVLRYAGATPDRAGMGTTVVVAVVRGNTVVVGNVGDSRAYLLTADQMVQVSVDHTKVGELVRNGVITPEQALEHGDRGVLSQAVGQRRGVNPYVSEPITLTQGALLVLCSDGVYEELPDDELAALVRGPGDLNAMADALVARAVVVDGKDNATAVLARFGTAPAAAPGLAATAPTSAVTGQQVTPSVRVEPPPASRPAGGDQRARPPHAGMIKKKRVGWLLLVAVVVGLAAGLALGGAFSSGTAPKKGRGEVEGRDDERPTATASTTVKTPVRREEMKVRTPNARPVQEAKAPAADRPNPFPVEVEAHTGVQFERCDPNADYKKKPDSCDEHSIPHPILYRTRTSLHVAHGTSTDCQNAGYLSMGTGSLCGGCVDSRVCATGTNCEKGVCKGRSQKNTDHAVERRNKNRGARNSQTNASATAAGELKETALESAVSKEDETAGTDSGSTDDASHTGPSAVAADEKDQLVDKKPADDKPTEAQRGEEGDGK